LLALGLLVVLLVFVSASHFRKTTAPGLSC